MKSMILAAFAAIGLSVGVAQIAQAAPSHTGQTSSQQSNGGLMGGGG